MENSHSFSASTWPGPVETGVSLATLRWSVANDYSVNQSPEFCLPQSLRGFLLETKRQCLKLA